MKAPVPEERIPIPAAIPGGECKISRVVVRHGSVSHIDAYTIIMWVVHVEIHVGKERIVVSERGIRPVEPSDP